MASILKFPHEARAASPAAAPQGESAQILFFTGVRYERAAAEAKEPRRPRRRRPQRRTKSA